MTKLSIIIPLYNKENTIRRSLESILRQDVNEYEIIVVNDGSNDKSSDIVKSFSYECIQLISTENKGVSSARNKGICHASGEWLVFLDADDELTQDSLLRFYQATELYPTAEVFIAGETNEAINHTHDYKKGRIIKFPLFYVWLNKLHPRPGALFLKRSILEYGYDERISFYEDFLFMLKALNIKKVVVLPYISVIYHKTPVGLSASPHPLEKEMAYYIPEILAKGDTTFWERALLYENIEQEIAWWQGHPKELAFYRDMQRKHFAWYHKHLHWLRQQLMRHGIL